MEVKIKREIRDYTESIFFGLSLRQFLFSIFAYGVAIILYFILKPHMGSETLSWVVILAAIPFAVLGFSLNIVSVALSQVENGKVYTVEVIQQMMGAGRKSMI